jgi:hypothetical protein
MKYILEEWDNSDLATKELAFSTNVTAGIDAAQDHNRYDIISHLLGMSALSEEGGIWIGSKATPPCIEGKFIDFEKIMRMEGLIIATNQRARRVGGSSIYLTTTFMAASKGHPWVRMIAERASDNTLQMFKSGYSNWPVRYYAGNTFLSRNLAGFYSVLPFTYLQSIGVFSQVTKESEEDALD